MPLNIFTLLVVDLLNLNLLFLNQTKPIINFYDINKIIYHPPHYIAQVVHSEKSRHIHSDNQFLS